MGRSTRDPFGCLKYNTVRTESVVGHLCLENWSPYETLIKSDFTLPDFRTVLPGHESLT